MNIKDSIIEEIKKGVEAEIVAEGTKEVEAVVVVEAAAEVVEEACGGKMKKEELNEAKDKQNAKMDVDGDMDNSDSCEMKEEINPVAFDELFGSLDLALTEDEKSKLFEGSELPEELKESLTKLFQEAVEARCKKGMKKGMDEAFKLYTKKMKESIDALDAKGKTYMEGVAAKWLKENQIALESNVRLRLMESFFTGLQGLFEQHYIDLPESKVSLVEKLQEKIQRLEEKYDARSDELIKLQESIEVSKRAELLKESTKELTDVQADKIRSLIEGLQFESTEAFSAKLEQVIGSVVAVKEVITENEKEPEVKPVFNIQEAMKQAARRGLYT